MISWIIKKMKAIDLIQINLSKCPYRVGDVFTTTNAVNPSEYYKGTEWNVFAPGRVLVGVDSGQELFKTGGLEGGEQKVKLTESQIPSHTHIQNAHNHTQKAHGHAVRYKGFNIPSQVGGYAALRRNETADDYDGTDTNAAISATAVNNATTAVNQSTGGGQAHNNMQPYRTVYYFVRVK